MVEKSVILGVVGATIGSSVNNNDLQLTAQFYDPSAGRTEKNRRPAPLNNENLP
jgi:hypothetical protein